MIALVSLRLLYLIFQQALSLIGLLGRRTSSKAERRRRPNVVEGRTSSKDIELLVLRLVLRHEVAILRRTTQRHV
jgi:hypothetical protein